MIQLIIKNVVLYNDKIEIHFNYTEAKRPDDEKHRAFSFYSFKKSVMIDQHKLGKPPIEIEYEIVLSILPRRRIKTASFFYEKNAPRF